MFKTMQHKFTALLVHASLAVVGLMLFAGGAGAVEPSTTLLRPFVVVQSVQWKGLNAAVSTLTLTQNGPDRWTYSTKSEGRGLARLLLPGDITQTSQFTIVDGAARPEHFRGDDGSSDDSKDVSFDFDWVRNRVTGVAERKAVSLELRSGIQDDLTAQITTMLELARGGRLPPSFWVVDNNEFKEYLYRQEGTARLQTAVGALDTIIVSSQRKGSPRTIRTWFAPSLGYVPVKAERTRAGKLEFSMAIRSIQR